MATIGIILLIVGGILALIGGVMGLIVAFRTSLLWGFGTLFVPLVGLVFLILHWAEAKRPFFIQLGGIALIVIGSLFGRSQMTEVSDARTAAVEQLRTAETRPRRLRNTSPPATPPEQAPATTEQPTTPEAPAISKTPIEAKRPEPKLPAPKPEAKTRVPEPSAPPRVQSDPVLTGPPVKIESIQIVGDSNESLRQLKIRISNASAKPVQEVRLALSYLDDSGHPLKEWTTSHSEDGNLVSPGATNEFTHPAYFMPQFSKRVTVRVIRAKFTDGTEWTGFR